MRVIPVLVVSLLFTCHALAQPANSVLVGVIVSRSGEASPVGTAQASAVTEWSLRRSAAALSAPGRLKVVDDAGSAPVAVELADALIGDGALALVCCSTPAATAAVAELAEQAGVLHLSPSDPRPGTMGGADGYWSFTLWPSESDSLSAAVSAVYAAGRHRVALMTSDDDLGRSAASALRPMLTYAGLQLVHAEAFPAGTRELRPEALLVAANQPSAVLVWAHEQETRVAVRALRSRGYEGPVYVRSALAAPGQNARAVEELLSEARAALPHPGYSTAGSGDCVPAQVPVPLDGLASDWRAAVAAAPVLDAMTIVEAAYEQLYLLQVPPDSPTAVMRQALRDAAVGLPPVCGSVGTLDLREGATSAVVPGSLTFVGREAPGERLP